MIVKITHGDKVDIWRGKQCVRVSEKDCRSSQRAIQFSMMKAQGPVLDSLRTADAIVSAFIGQNF